MKLTAVLLCFTLTVYGQSDREYIIKYTSPADQAVATTFAGQTVQSVRAICPDLQLYAIGFEESPTDAALDQLRAQEGVIGVWEDADLDPRTVPNDALFTSQWAITLAKIDEVWDFTTGGSLETGQDIVVAVLDNGFDLNHEDLSAQIWTNDDETPDNGVDDDNNGYTDDYFGLNVTDGSDNHQSLSHGTSVMGLIGASGNNSVGISGVNWNVRILPVSGVNKVSKIIEAYNYILMERRLYNQTDGEKGSLIAVSSYSGGIDNVFGNEGVYKEWCDLYDLLGAEGVLNFGATSNRFVDVDEVGDMPSTCVSDYFIGVTSLKRGGEIDMASAYGVVSVDLAAPGDGLITTDPNNQYNPIEGTSAATPMAAGAAALLFSVPCRAFAEYALSNPAEAALLIKQVLLEGVTKVAGMKTLYVSGGYLNAGDALRRMNDVCDGELLIPSEVGALRITNVSQNGSILSVGYVSPNGRTHFIRWVNVLGQILHYEEFTPPEFGQKVFDVVIPPTALGPTFLSIGNNKNTASRAYFIRK